MSSANAPRAVRVMKSSQTRAFDVSSEPEAVKKALETAFADHGGPFGFEVAVDLLHCLQQAMSAIE